MKPSKAIALISFISIFLLANQAFSFNWILLGPAGIKANKIRFINGLTMVICIDTGMYVSDDYNGNGDWEFFSYGNLPVTDVLEAGQNGYTDSLIVIMGDGSYSDGIYSFNLITHVFNPINYCIKPHFIVYFEFLSKYFVGFDWGLLESDDLLNWNTVPKLEGVKCFDFAEGTGFYEEHGIILTQNPDHSYPYFYWDEGYGWHPYISPEQSFIDVEATSMGHYAISHDPGNEGLYFSDYLPNGFESEFLTDNLNALGKSSFESLFIGWNQGTYPDIGVARYQNGLVNISDGLPDQNINSLHSHYIIGWDRIYCCTNSGVYFCGDFTAGGNENNESSIFNIYPNPIYDNLYIDCNRVCEKEFRVSIYNYAGGLVGSGIGWQSIFMGLKDLPSGLYLLNIVYNDLQFAEKFVKN